MGSAATMMFLPFKRSFRTIAVAVMVSLFQGNLASAQTNLVQVAPATMPVDGLLEATTLFRFNPPLLSSQDYLPPAPVVQATHLVLRLNQKRVYVHSNDKVLADFPVAVGAPNTPTPTGEFKIFQMIVDPVWQSPWTGEVFPPGPNSALGLRWIGFASMDNGIIGFHGTPTVSSIGSAASNGCVRLRNEDVLALYAHARMGMTVIVEP
jgi:hypothetical protein